MSQPIRKTAMDIIVSEERANGCSPLVLGAAALEKEHGCDILSTSPGGGPPRRIEVKGWGEPFRGPSGKFRYSQDLRESQMQAARGDDDFRIEIVANLTLHLEANEPYERLTLTATEVQAAKPRLWEVDLSGKEAEIKVVGDGGH